MIMALNECSPILHSSAVQYRCPSQHQLTLSQLLVVSVNYTRALPCYKDSGLHGTNIEIMKC